MARKICGKCGASVIEEARFCTTCGASMSAETASAAATETNPVSAKPADRTSAVKADVTEELGAPSPYDTEEMAPPAVAARAEEKPTDAPAPQPQINPAPARQAASARKGLLLAAALGVMALAAGSFFFINSRGSSEAQATNQPAGEANTPATTQPSAQPSVAANEQATPQTEPTVDDLKLAATKSADAGSKAQQARGAATPATAQEKSGGDGTGAAAHNLNQGMAHLTAGRYQDALREFEYVKSLDPGNKSVYYLIGQAYHKMGQLERALEAYRQCTSGVYASIAQNHVRTLEKRIGKTY